MEILVFDTAPLMGQHYLVLLRPYGLPDGANAVLTFDRDGSEIQTQFAVPLPDERLDALEMLATRIGLQALPERALPAIFEQITSTCTIEHQERP